MLWLSYETLLVWQKECNHETMPCYGRSANISALAIPYRSCLLPFPHPPYAFLIQSSLSLKYETHSLLLLQQNCQTTVQRDLYAITPPFGGGRDVSWPASASSLPGIAGIPLTGNPGEPISGSLMLPAGRIFLPSSFSPFITL